ncbi:hypothetical protein Tco_1133745 [Tanacetum coccineum]
MARDRELQSRPKSQRACQICWRRPQDAGRDEESFRAVDREQNGRADHSQTLTAVQTQQRETIRLQGAGYCLTGTAGTHWGSCTTGAARGCGSSS